MKGRHKPRSGQGGEPLIVNQRTLQKSPLHISVRYQPFLAQRPTTTQVMSSNGELITTTNSC